MLNKFSLGDEVKAIDVAQQPNDKVVVVYYENGKMHHTQIWDRIKTTEDEAYDLTSEMLDWFPPGTASWSLIALMLDNIFEV